MYVIRCLEGGDGGPELRTGDEYSGLSMESFRNAT